MRKGPVSSRVALLLRSAEGKPFFASISQYSRSLPQCRVVTIILCFVPSGALDKSAYSAATYLPVPTCLPTVPARLGRVFRAEGVPTTLPGQASRGRAEAAGGEASRGGGGGARAGCLPALEERFLGPSSCFPWRRFLVVALACPGGKWTERSCLPWRRVLGLGSCWPWRRVWSARSCLPGRRFGCEALPALEEDGPSVFACPGGEEGRELG